MVAEERLPNEIPISREQFAAFGSIIHSFAHLEWIIQLTMAAVSDLDFGKVILLTRELTYAGKRDTLFSYMEYKQTPEEQIRKDIKELLNNADKHNPLRNHIAHSIWRQGSRPNSIRPVTIRVRGGRGKIVGSDDEPDYTDAELFAVADTLHQLHNHYVALMWKHYPAFMEE
jgi:hypothetical protein